jgi:hypothetical protein
MSITNMLIATCLLISCGGTTSAALDKSKREVALSEDEAKQVCDQIATLFGGYGQSVACDGGAPARVGPSSQAKCISEFPQAKQAHPDCPATVQQVEACLQWMLMCSPMPAPDACSVVMSSQCTG